jgi:hypothetical protein
MATSRLLGTNLHSMSELAIMHLLRAPPEVEPVCFEGRRLTFPGCFILSLLFERRVGMARTQRLPKVPLSTGPDHDRKFYGANLAEVFRTPLYDCSLKNVCGVPDFALTRLKGGSMELQQAPAYPEDRAMLICVALAPTPVDRWRARIDGQEVSVSHSIAFATTVIDL